MLRVLLLATALTLPISAFAQDAGQVERVVPQSTTQIQLSFAPVVERVAPAVVNVYATRVTQQRPSTGDPFFDQFFGNSPLFRQRPQTSQSLGSGVIVSPQGTILTNNHVVEGATDIRVVLQDGREYPVDAVLTDPATDLAVLSIRNPDREFPSVAFANSDALAVGDLVLAIGNPFGVGQSVTSGIVSALARTGMGVTDYQAFIQTDAAINPGNSGGALVDLDGNLVGINTALFTRSGGSEGIGFAIPSNMARSVALAAENGGEIVWPWLGARMQSLDSELAIGLGLETPRGALVTEVAPQSPAERAGLQAGDVITAIDAMPVQDPDAVNYRIATLPIGTAANFSVMRNGAALDLALDVAGPPTRENAEVEITGNTRFAGATAAELDPALADSLGLAFSAQGVAITAVAPGSFADRLGLDEGDIILSLNGIAIRDIETFRQIASQRPQSWQIELQREGRVIRSFVSG